MSKLVEILNATKHKYVKIGAGTGNGFFYVGSVDNFQKNLNRITKACKKAAQHEIDQKKARFEKLCAEYPTIEDFAKEYGLSDKKDELTAENYISLLDRHFARIRKASESWALSQDNFSKFKPMTRREVIRYDDSFVDEDCLIVIVEGYELGKYWMTSEASTDMEVGFSTDMEVGFSTDEDETEDTGKEDRQVA